MSTGTELIYEERLKQSELGYDNKHDDAHKTMDLTRAALCYAYCAGAIQSAVVKNGEPLEEVMEEIRDADGLREHFMEIWPWSNEDWKPKESVIDNLKIAGALIAAEIDKLTRERNKLD